MSRMVKSQYLTNVDFSKGAWVYYKGAGLSLVVNLAAIPVLSRLYTPSEFGEFAFFLALAKMASVFVSGKYEFAMPIPKKSVDSARVFLGGVYFSLLMSVVVLVALLFVEDRLVSLFESKMYARLVWLIPLVGFLLALKEFFKIWEARRQRIESWAKGKVLYSVLINGIRFPRAVFSSGGAGLWLGFIVAELVFLAGCIRRFLKFDGRLAKTWRPRISMEPLLRFSNYPIFSMPLSLLNFVASNLLLFVFSINFSMALVGIYDRFLVLVGIPMELLGASLGAFLYGKKSKGKYQKINLLAVFFGCIFLALLLYAPVMVWGSEMFAFVLGADWAFAGVLAQYLAPLIVVTFAVKCTLPFFNFKKVEKIMLVWQLIYLLLSVFWICLFRNHSLIFIVKTYAVLGAFLYLLLAAFFFVRSYRIAT